MRGRRVVFRGIQEIVLEDYDVQRPQPDQVLVETLYSAISPGTERAMLLAQPNTVTADRGFPFEPGYSNVGRVIEAGAEVRNYRAGDLVATVQTHRSHVVLPDTVGPGVPPQKYAHLFTSPITPGVAVPQLHHLWKLPADASPALLRSLSAFGLWVVGLGGVRKARIEIGEPVLVLGLGPIGLAAAKHAQLAGGFPVIGVDPSPVRREKAKAFGLDGILENAAEHAGGFAAKVVIEATGRPEVVPEAFRLCANQGRVVLLSSTRGATQQVDFYSDVHRKGITVFGAHESARPVHESRPGYWTAWEDRDVVLRLLGAGRLPGRELISHAFRAADVALAYRAVLNSPDALSIALEWK
jgi:threonine dehydrogenase-like Zn-dependent dehydrogenase